MSGDPVRVGGPVGLQDAVDRVLVRLADGRQGTLEYFPIPVGRRRPVPSGRRSRRSGLARVLVQTRRVYVDPASLTYLRPSRET